MHPFNVGITVIVAVMSVFPVFVAVNTGKFPLPLAAKPILVFELVQLKLAPVGRLVNGLEFTSEPSQKVWFDGSTS